MSAKRKYILGAAFLVLTFVSCFALIYYWDEIKHFGSYGYPFAFLVSFFAGCSLPNPFPYIVVIFTLSSVLNPAVVGAASGLGAGMGGTLVYLSARGGHSLFSRFKLFSSDVSEAPGSRLSRWMSRIQGWAQRKGLIVVFIMSALFNPLFLPMAIGMAVLRFRIWKFFLMCWAGNTVKSLAIAYAGYFGLGTLLRWLGIGGI